MRIATLLRTIPLLSLAGLVLGASGGDLVLSATLPVGGEGRWDYITCDQEGRYLYVPRSSHVMVLEAATGKTVADLAGTPGVHGVALAPDVGRGFTSNGQDGTVTVFDLKTNQPLGTVAAADDADCILYEASSHQVLVFCGDARAAVVFPASIPMAPGAAGTTIQLGGKPEFAASDGAGHVYVNLTDTSEVAVLDLAAATVTARWPLAPGAHPTGLAVDAAAHRLYSGCRNQKLIVLDTVDGHLLATLPIGSGVDAVACLDGGAAASCGDGTLSVVRAGPTGTFAVVQTLTTAPGARTMAVDAAHGRIYLPTAELAPSRMMTAANPHPRPIPVPGTFRILTVAHAQP